jgi:hypothetical protein
MGPRAFKPPQQDFHPSSLNLSSRADSASGYAAKTDASNAAKDLAAAKAFKGLTGTTKDAAADAPGPKKV